MRILHLSDTHLESFDGPNRHGVNARESLTRMLDDCRYLQPLDLVVVSGDVTDDGSVGAYTAAAARIGAFARSRGAAYVFCMGNHDDRGTFGQVLGSGHYDADGHDVGELVASVTAERAAVSRVGDLRIITLDTTVLAKGFGWLTDTQLDWLRDQLATRAPAGTVVVMHHPPMTTGNQVQQALKLQNGQALADALAASDVRVVLCGHFHLQLQGWLGTIPVLVTPGVVSRVDLTAEPGTERAVRGASATVVDLVDGQPPVSYLLHARDPDVGRVAYEASAAQLTRIISELGPPVRRLD
ncbi:MAG: metallophosphoesterase [Propionibacteriaceae bacterium]